MGGAAAGGAVAAAAHKRRLQEEEEEERMAGYNSKDLDGWEFKIVRANSRRFRTAEAVRQLCEEEAKTGWEMVEKFDDQRIRFKRHVEKRADDRLSEIDPYRTLVGFSEGKIVLIVLAVIAVAGLVGLLVFSAVR